MKFTNIIFTSVLALGLTACDNSPNLTQTDRARLEQQAAAGNAYAMNKLGEYYHFTPALDLEKAKSYYERAAAAGNGEAANHLGRIYTNGEGVTKDMVKALEWYEMGAKLGNKEAAYNVQSVKSAITK